MILITEKNKNLLPVLDRLQKIIFLSALLLTVISQDPLFGKLSWIMLIIICGFNANFSAYAVFFFSAFFIPSVFNVPLFFTIKHFHIAFVVLLAVYFLKQNLFYKIRKNVYSIFPFVPWLLILSVSFISSILYHQTHSALSMSANILSVVISFSVIACILVGEYELILNSLLFFIFGVSTRIFLAADKTFYGWPVSRLAEPLIHNTHVGFLASSSLFLLLPFILTKQDFKKQLVSWFMLIFVSMGLLLSCSRTAWFSALISYFLFFILLFLLRHTNHLPKMKISIKWFIAGVSLLFFTLLLVGICSSQEMMDRLAALQIFFEADYWQYILQDRQNFGPFGFFRLAQFSTVGNIIKHNFLFGVGLSREVTDFHCFYLTIFGGTGLFGLFLFFSFCFLWMKSLLRQMFQGRDDLNVFRIGVFCAFFVWLVSSLMETFIIQFNVWMIITMGIILTQSAVAGKTDLSS